MRCPSVLPLPAWALLAVCLAGSAHADIRTTPHRLIRDSAKADAADICVFCHTPKVSGHPPANAPLWQKAIGTDLVFTIYDDIGRLGLGKESIGSQSMACLSCHDTNQARAISKTSADHPFGVPYRGAVKHGLPEAGQGSSASGNGTGGLSAKHLRSLDDFRDASHGMVENRNVWWVSSFGVTSRRTRNDLPLYTRHYDETNENIPFIECSSCHDPHTDTVKFLRVPPESSRLCLTCHLK